jgi:HAD superfamily hydrolase (TIGR01548 family)
MVKLRPQIVIFDVDGVLVDVRGSFHRSIVQTVRHFTGCRVTHPEIHRWKSKSGYNDDWKLSTDWIASLGRTVGYDEVKKQFEEFYWGRNGDGNVALERWLVPRARLRRWAERAELALFTGRTRHELEHTLAHFRVKAFFRRIVTTSDVERPKPHPEGLLRILNGREPASALYVGDNIDDALAAQHAGIPFLGVLPRASAARRQRVAGLRCLGAKKVLGSIIELEKWWAR